MDYLYLFLLKLFCLGIAFFVFYLLHTIDGSAIVEIGYNSISKKRLKKKKIACPRWDHFLHWSLANNAPRCRNYVWIYFGLHLLACFGLIVSVVLFFIPVSIEAWHGKIGGQLYWSLGIFTVHTGIRIILDILILPSEKRRYGVRSKKDKRTTKE